MINAGTYLARGTDAEFGFANSKEQIAIRFRIEGGAEDGQELAWYGFFTDKTAERTLEALRFCGWDTDNLGDVIAEVVGRNLVRIVVEHDTYNGNTRAKIAWVNRAGGPLVRDKLSGGQRSDLAKRMKALAMRVDKAKAAPANVNAPPAARATDHAGDTGYFDNAPPPGDGDDF